NIVTSQTCISSLKKSYSSQYYASIALASVLLSAATTFFDREEKKIKDAPYDGFEGETSILHYGTSSISTGESVLYIFT
ncbi:hypothetical protein ACJX0J_008638, partial [Zea mays]